MSNHFENVKHCPYCDEDPNSSGHYLASRQLFQIGASSSAVMIGLICTNAVGELEESSETFFGQMFWLIEAPDPPPTVCDEYGECGACESEVRGPELEDILTDEDKEFISGLEDKFKGAT